MKRATWILIVLAAGLAAALLLQQWQRQRAFAAEVDALVAGATQRVSTALAAQAGAAPDIVALAAADFEEGRRIVDTLARLRGGPVPALGEAAGRYLSLARELIRHCAALPRLRAEMDEARRALEARLPAGKRKGAPAAEVAAILRRYEAANRDLVGTAGSLAGLLDGLTAVTKALAAQRSAIRTLAETERLEARSRALAEAKAAAEEMGRLRGQTTRN